MPQYAYIARDLSGKEINGELTAASERDVSLQLAQQSLFALEIRSAAAGQVRLRGRRVGGQLLATTFAQLSDLLRSGVPLLRALDSLRKQCSHARLSEVLEGIHRFVEEGGTLADALARHPDIFSNMAISMVRAGGEGGFLEESLDRVAEFTEKQEDLKGRTIGALAYPIFLAVIGMVVIVGLMVFAVPRFEGLFARLKARGQLPAVTEWLLATSAFMQSWWWVVLIAIVGLWLLYKNRAQRDGEQLWRDKWILRMPGWGMIARQMAVGRFCRVLGTMLRNGVPILKALDISSSAAGNAVLAQGIRAAAENVSAGQSLARPLEASGQFPPTVLEMIAVAEESNTLDRVLIETADRLEKRTWRQLDLAVRLIEPLLLLVLATFVLMLAVALLLPVIRMSTAIG